MIYIKDYGYTITFIVNSPPVQGASVFVSYISPSGAFGDWQATTYTQNNKLVVKLDVSDTTFIEEGIWGLRVVITDNANYRYSSDMIRLYVLQPINLSTKTQLSKPQNNALKNINVYVNIHDSIVKEFKKEQTNANFDAAILTIVKREVVL